MEVWAPLLRGGCLVVIEQATLLAPERFKRSLLSRGVNVMWLTVGLFNQYAVVWRMCSRRFTLPDGGR